MDTSFKFAFINLIIMCLRKEKNQSKQDQSPPSPTLDDNKYEMIISEEICSPYCRPPSPIQELP